MGLALEKRNEGLPLLRVRNNQFIEHKNIPMDNNTQNSNFNIIAEFYSGFPRVCHIAVDENELLLIDVELLDRIGQI